MTETQLHLSVGLPVIAILIGILVNVNQFSALTTRLSQVESCLDGRINALESRLDARFANMESKFDILVGKVIELDNRLTRLEERLKH